MRIRFIGGKYDGVTFRMNIIQEEFHINWPPPNRFTLAQPTQIEVYRWDGDKLLYRYFETRLIQKPGAVT